MTKPTVIAAMSGGVDSSAAAALLKQEGYNVIGVTLRLCPSKSSDKLKWCCGRDAEEQAAAAAEKIGIPHSVQDASDIFEEEILRPAWQEYDNGRTPSPCILCNDRIKFRLLAESARKLGAAHVATGHYARAEKTQNGPVLLRGKDKTKDQSYFLFSLSPEHLSLALFPLGGLLKTEVRKLAQKFNLPNAAKKDSQDACFSYGTEEGFAEALRIYFNAVSRPGAIINTKGERVGNHQGIHLYTIGQRKKLRIAVGKRAYVCRIDADRDKIVLTADPKDLECGALYASGVTWTGGAPPKLPTQCEAQIRYRHRPTRAVASVTENGMLKVCFEQPESAAAPGQAVVLFDGERVLGGGWIDRTEPSSD